MWQWLCHHLFCLYRLQIGRLRIPVTMSLFNHLTSKTNNCWHSIDTYFNVLSSQNLLISVFVSINIWTYRLSFWLIETWPFGKSNTSNILAWVALILLKFIFLAEVYILPAMDVFINIYSHTTGCDGPIILLTGKLLVNQHLEPGENIFTHSVVYFHGAPIQPRFHCCDIQKLLVRLSLWPHCWPNQSTTNQFSSQISLLRLSGTSMVISSSTWDTLSASQLSSLTFGLPNLPFQRRHFSMSEMVSGALSSSLSAW